MTVLVAGPVYSPTRISRFSAVTLEVEGRVRITCRHPCGFSDSSCWRFCVSIPGKPPGAGLEPKPKPNGLSSAAGAPGSRRLWWSRDAGEGRTDKLQRGSDTLHPPPAASCPSCPHALRPAELDTWGLCRTVLTALRAPRASPERNPTGGTFKN